MQLVTEYGLFKPPAYSIASNGRMEMNDIEAMSNGLF
jgi:hypothetical protein